MGAAWLVSGLVWLGFPAGRYAVLAGSEPPGIQERKRQVPCGARFRDSEPPGRWWKHQQRKRTLLEEMGMVGGSGGGQGRMLHTAPVRCMGCIRRSMVQGSGGFGSLHPISCWSYEVKNGAPRWMRLL